MTNENLVSLIVHGCSNQGCTVASWFVLNVNKVNPPIKDKCKLKSMFISLKFMYFKQNPQDFSKARDLGGNKLDIISGLQKIRKGKKE